METPPQFSHALTPHFYRAVVGHMDVWRQRMDATTNWSAATTAGMVTFSFSTADTPHFVLLLALAFNLMFLLMESRRYQVFDLWRRRFRLLNQYLVNPVIAPGQGPRSPEIEEALRRIAADLGRTVPHLSLVDAVGYRIRRNYIYVVTVTLFAWLLKLEVHPTATSSFTELVSRAQIGGVPGSIVLVLVGGLVLGMVLLAARAPSEQMLNWAPVPAPFDRWIRRRRSHRGSAEAGDGTRLP
jgi:uncharacterized membrane protein